MQPHRLFCAAPAVSLCLPASPSLLPWHAAHALAAPAVSFVSDSAASIALGFAPFCSPLAASAAMCINFCIAAAEAAAAQDAITMEPRHFPVCQLVINGPRARPVSPAPRRRRRRRCRCRLILRNLRLIKRRQQQQQQPRQPAATDFVAS